MHNIFDSFDDINLSSENIHHHSFEEQSSGIVFGELQDLSHQQINLNHELNHEQINWNHEHQADFNQPQADWNQQHQVDLNLYHTDSHQQHQWDLYQQQPELNQQYQVDYHQQNDLSQQHVDFNHNQTDWNQQVNLEQHFTQSRCGSSGSAEHHTNEAQKEAALRDWNQQNADKAAENAKWYAENHFPDKAESYANQASQWQDSADAHNKAAQKESEKAADFLKKEAQEQKNNTNN